jgi:membrane-bound metal-dependent hydrolase YbcI (DUF457 family)
MYKCRGYEAKNVMGEGCYGCWTVKDVELNISCMKSESINIWHILLRVLTSPYVRSLFFILNNNIYWNYLSMFLPELWVCCKGTAHHLGPDTCYQSFQLALDTIQLHCWQLEYFAPLYWPWHCSFHSDILDMVTVPTAASFEKKYIQFLGLICFCFYDL